MMTLCLFSCFLPSLVPYPSEEKIVRNSGGGHPKNQGLSIKSSNIMEKIHSQIKVSEVKLVYKNKIKPENRIQISGSQEAFEILYQHWDKDSIEHVEEFKILLLNRANMVLGIASLFKGGVVGTVIDPRIIFQYALKANAAQIILAHNHPSGNIKPSDADRAITKKIKEGAKQLDIIVLDHIILTGDGEYYSFAEEGDL